MAMKLPEAFLDAIDDVARATFGANDAVGSALAARVARLSELYTRERDAIEEASDPALAPARLRFFLPRDAMKAAWPLAELCRMRPLGPRLRVLDVGAGHGAMTFGASLIASDAKLDVIAVDADAHALDSMRALAARARGAGLAEIALETRVADLADARAHRGGPFDLVLIGLALNEWAHDRTTHDTVALLERLGALLADDGSLVVVEPALRAPTRALHAVRDAIVARGRLSVFAPCLRGDACPMLARERDWCHEDRPYTLPARLVPIAREAGLRFEGLTYSYLTLRRDGRTLRDALPAPRGSGTTQPGELFRIVGGPGVTKGKLELFGCGRPGMPLLARLDRHRSDANAGLDGARRGDVVAVDPPPAAIARAKIGPTTAVNRLAAHDGTNVRIGPGDTA